VVRRVPEPGGSLPAIPRSFQRPPQGGDAEPAQALVQPANDLDQASDEALVHALLSQHGSAARVLWQRFSPMVRRIVRRTLGPASDAEDLVQDAFLQLFAKVHTLREPRALKAFIITVTTLTVRRELRRRKLRSWLGLLPDPSAGDLCGVHPDPVGRAALERFYSVLDRLDVRERTAFALRHIEGMAMSDVAGALGVSLATAKRSVAHAQRRVQLHVERDPLLSDYLSQAFAEDGSDTP
jgi:RNA polymerase sigma-70 factor, ECF subfamily